MTSYCLVFDLLHSEMQSPSRIITRNTFRLATRSTHSVARQSVRPITSITTSIKPTLSVQNKSQINKMSTSSTSFSIPTTLHNILLTSSQQQTPLTLRTSTPSKPPPASPSPPSKKSLSAPSSTSSPAVPRSPSCVSGTTPEPSKTPSPSPTAASNTRHNGTGYKSPSPASSA